MSYLRPKSQSIATQSAKWLDALASDLENVVKHLRTHAEDYRKGDWRRKAATDLEYVEPLIIGLLRGNRVLQQAGEYRTRRKLLKSGAKPARIFSEPSYDESECGSW